MCVCEACDFAQSRQQFPIEPRHLPLKVILTAKLCNLMLTHLQVQKTMPCWFSLFMSLQHALSTYHTLKGQCPPRSVTITYDVVPTVGASVVLQQPWIHTLPVEPMGTGDDPKFLQRERGGHSMKNGLKGGTYAFSLTHVPPPMYPMGDRMCWCPPAKR